MDLVESEGDKELYIETDKRTGEPEKSKYRKYDELEILKKREQCDDIESGTYDSYKSTYNIVNVGIDINGNRIDATEEEKVEFVNNIGADLYIRKVIYDGSVATVFVDPEGNEHDSFLSSLAAYYTDDNIETAKKYIENSERNAVKKFENEIVSENSKVPTIVSAVGYRTSKNGKYIINYFRFGDTKGIGNAYGAINTKSASSLIETNNEKNEETKNIIEKEIESAKVNDDTEEFVISREERKAEERAIEKADSQKWDMFGLNKNELIFMAIIGCAILLNIIIIMKNKRRRKNGK